MHINGNALYAVGSAGFDEFLARVRSFYPPRTTERVVFPGCATGTFGEEGFDHAIFNFRRHGRVFDYSREVAHRFHFTEYILNLCEDPYDEATLRAAHPETFLVHSKAPYLSKDERFVRQWYWERTLQWPERQWHEHLLGNLSVPALRDQLERELCTSTAYKDLVQRNRPLAPCVRLCERNVTLRAHEPRLCRLASERQRWETILPPERPYVWTTDLHVGPAACYQPLLREMGAELHAEIDFYNCEFQPEFCKRRLKVLHFNEWRGFSLDPCPQRLREDFFDAYKNEPEMRRVDLIVCSHPVANCELYMPFNRSMLVYATTRLEFGRDDRFVDWRKPYLNRHSPQRWKEWVTNLQLIATRPGNVIAANNMYDVQYIKYHTGLDAQYMPSWCEPTEKERPVVYAPQRGQPVLLGMYRDNLDFPNFSDAASWQHPILRGLSHAAETMRSSFTFKRMHELYERYEWSDLMRHPALVLIPYQVSTISFFEIYRTNLPIFAPSLRLLCSWIREHGIMWERMYGTPDRLADRRHLAGIADPNANCSNATCSLEYWIGLSDWYVFEHVTLFDSWDDLVQQLARADLRAISQAMAEYNRAQRVRLRAQWQRVLEGAVSMRSGRQEPLWHDTRTVDYREAMRALYSVPLLTHDSGEAAWCDKKPSGDEKSVYGCVSSDDALYYGCRRSFEEGQWTPDGDAVVNCRRFPRGEVGNMCPKSLPACVGFRNETALGVCQAPGVRSTAAIIATSLVALAAFSALLIGIWRWRSSTSYAYACIRLRVLEVLQRSRPVGVTTMDEEEMRLPLMDTVSTRLPPKMRRRQS